MTLNVSSCTQAHSPVEQEPQHSVDHPPEPRASRMKFTLCAVLVVAATSASQVENDTNLCLRVTWLALTMT